MTSDQDRHAHFMVEALKIVTSQPGHLHTRKETVEIAAKMADQMLGAHLDHFAGPAPAAYLQAALRVLATVHTRDDFRTGFQIMAGAAPQHAGVSGGEYVKAWATVRRALGLVVLPDEGGSK